MERPLTELHQKAIQLLAQGHDEMTVAADCGRSRGWVQKVKRRSDYQSLISQAKNAVAVTIVQTAKRITEDEVISHFEKIKRYRQELEQLSLTCMAVSKTALSIIQQKAEMLTPEELSANKLPQNIKTLAEAVNTASNIAAEALGISQLERILASELEDSEFIDV